MISGKSKFDPFSDINPKVQLIHWKLTDAVKVPPVSCNEVIEELPRLTFEERQILIRRAVELDDSPLSAAAEDLVEARLAEHHADPNSSVSLNEMKRRLRR